MNEPSLISLYSPSMQSGKSVVANTLVADCDYHLVKFADPLKSMVREFLSMTGAPKPLIEEMLEGSMKEKPIPGLGVSTRHLMQTLGTEWGRDQVHRDLWVNLTRHTIEQHGVLGHNVVIDDMRFPNELEMVTELGGHVVRVDRTGTSRYAGHTSEGLLDSYPMTTINNAGSKEELQAFSRTLPQILQNEQRGYS